MFLSFAKSTPFSLTWHPKRPDSVFQLWCLPSVYVRHLQLVMRTDVVHSPSGSSPWGFFLSCIETFGIFMCSSWYPTAALYPVAMQPALLPGNGITRSLPPLVRGKHVILPSLVLLFQLHWTEVCSLNSRYVAFGNRKPEHGRSRQLERRYSC